MVDESSKSIPNWTETLTKIRTFTVCGFGRCNDCVHSLRIGPEYWGVRRACDECRQHFNVHFVEAKVVFSKKKSIETKRQKENNDNIKNNRTIHRDFSQERW